MDAPPRHTPHSTRSPGTSSSRTVSTQCCRLVSRCIPIIVKASAGQSRPKSRAFLLNGRLRTSSRLRVLKGDAPSGTTHRHQLVAAVPGEVAPEQIEVCKTRVVIGHRQSYPLLRMPLLPVESLDVRRRRQCVSQCIRHRLLSDFALRILRERSAPNARILPTDRLRAPRSRRVYSSGSRAHGREWCIPGKYRPQIGNQSFGSGARETSGCAYLQLFDARPHIGWSPAVQRISEGIPARRPAAVVPEPP